MKLIIAAIGLITLAGCAWGERIDAQGQTEHQIVCGYMLPWATCESRAASLCPAGYDLVSKTWDAMSGSEMWVRCKSG